MGRRGPLPLAPNVRQLRGTARNTPARPQAVRAAPTAPSWLTAEARAEWKRVTPELERMGLLAGIDRALLTSYCSAWAKWVAVSRLLDTADPTVADPTHPDRPSGGIRKHPAWSVYFSLSTLVVSLAKELGLTPAARARMTVPESDESHAGGILDWHANGILD